MPPATKSSFLQWRQPLRDAAGQGDPVRLFLEHREDLTVEVDADGATSEHRTFWSGVSASRMGRRSRLVYRSEPSLDDLQRVADLARGDGSPTALALEGGDRKETVEDLEIGGRELVDGFGARVLAFEGESSQRVQKYLTGYFKSLLRTDPIPRLR